MANDYKTRCLEVLKKPRLLKIAARVGVGGVNKSTNKEIIIDMILSKTTARLSTMLNAFQKKELQELAKKLSKNTQGKKAELIVRILMSAGTWDLFLSYAKQDFNDYKEPFDALRSRYNVWYDQKEVKVGEKIRDKIKNGVLESLIAVIFVSEEYNKREHTRYELELISRFSKPKVPVVNEAHKNSVHTHFKGIHYFVWNGNSANLLNDVEDVYAQAKLA
ncbi:MAG: toll/interleukin-1 receptor domain-containing protein [Candidatus Thiodiazotropha sp. (ex Dulcina madagascariensis)]|nr:toll/interleukin-1 receptor domain-containing protein [Candidatus Thiodiazotropha sp. (ex Dulcina madagascariensis)]